MLTRTTTVSVLVVIGMCAGAGVASADDGWGTVDCDQAPTPQCGLEVGTTGRPPSTPRPSSETAGHDDPEVSEPVCAYDPSQFQGHPDAINSWPPRIWYQGRCQLTGAMAGPTSLAAVTPAEIARLARDQLRLPSPKIGANPAADQLVNLPTWLYLTDGWRTTRATASVPGVSVTATASPASVTWSMGDGTTVECAGPGTQFRPTGDPRSESPSCGHIYRRPSEDRTFPVTATVRWEITWSGAGQTGTLPALTTTAATRFRVRESQALNVTPR